MAIKHIALTLSFFVGLTGFAASQDATKDKGAVPMPPAGEAGTYDPQLTAKEAALTNWALAISGIRAGKVVSDNIVKAYGRDVPFDDLSNQAKFALKTMIVRYNSANWLIAKDETVVPVDGAAFVAAIDAANQVCEADPCRAERDAINSAFTEASAAFAETAKAAALAAKMQESKTDRELMADTLTDMADYLDGSGWYSDLTLTSKGKDGEEVAARLVGVLAIWNNIEAYVGLTNAEVDGAVNKSVDMLLRDMRRHTRKKPELKPDGKEVTAIKTSASGLAADLRRAADLFKG